MPCLTARVAASLLVGGLALPCCSNVSGAPTSTSGACAPSPAGDDDDGGDGPGACAPGDADGISGGCYAFDLTVDDTAFTPFILKAENDGDVTVTLTNTGTRPHGFVVDCLPTPNDRGCPAQSCFPAVSTIAPVPAGGTARVTFVTPTPEGIYIFRSNAPGDSELEADGGVTGLWGQFVVQ